MDTIPVESQRLADSWTMKAHDVRNVSAIMYCTAEELLHSSDPRTRLLGQRTLRACDRIVEICEDATKKHIKRCETSLSETLHAITELGRATAKSNTHVRMYLGFDASVRRDGIALFRVLANLVCNAITALNQAGGGVVLVRTTRWDGVPFILIEDSVAGKHGSAPEKKRSSGLGLLIATSLAEEIGGSLECTYSGSAGTVFALRLDPAMLGAEVEPEHGADRSRRASRAA